jgi:glycerol-3-phosphate dehydrogenase (NAD(P)+)
VLVSATKGLDAETEATPFEIWRDAFPEASLVVLSGPNLASEIQQGLPAAAVASSYDEAAVGQVQDLFASEQFRVYGNDDPIGTELGGILKNIMAIAAGICDGLELGANAKAALITRALPEMMRFGMYRGAQAETFWGLSGLGDVLTSCHSPRSRNYQVGFRLGQGESLSQVLATLEGTAEGVNTVRVVVRHAQRHGLSVPIAEAVASVLEGEVAPQTAVTQLMRRALRSEFGRSA